MRHMLSILSFSALLATTALAQSEAFLDTWEWVRTDYVSGGSDTPGSTGHGHQIMFGEWQKYEHLIDEQLVHRGHWEVTELLVFPYRVSVLSTDDGNSWLKWYVGDGELVVKDWIQLPFGVYGPHTRTERYSPRGAVAAEFKTLGTIKAAYR